MKIHFDFANQRISLEGDGPEIFKIMQAAAELAPKLPTFEIVTQPSVAGNTPKPSTILAGSGGDSAKGGNGSPHTLRQFARSLALSSLMDRIAAIGYYQKHHENKDVFSPREMSDWFVQCGFQKPAQMPVALSDAKRKYGYVDNMGHAMWRVSTQGENLIIGKMQEQPAESSG